MSRRRKKNTQEAEEPYTPFDFPEFDDLPATTITSVVYSNLKIDSQKLFNELPLSKRADPNVVLRSKQERKDFCEDFPKGEIISIQVEDRIRGSVIRKLKKHWCPPCQLSEPEGDPPIYKKVLTVTEVYNYNPKTDETEIKCYCSNCKKTYKAEDLKILFHFRNQVMVYMTTERNLVNLMIFASDVKITNIKMAGCSTIRESRQIIANFWKSKIYPTSSWKFFSPKSTQPRFVFEEAMININFRFGSFIDPEKFYELWSQYKSRKKVSNVTYGSASQKSINIKFPKQFAGVKAMITFPRAGAKTCELTEITDWPEDVKHVRKKKKKESQPTIVVFMTTSTLVTGQAGQELKHWYNFFRDITLEKEEEIKEVIVPLDYGKVLAILGEPIV